LSGTSDRVDGGDGLWDNSEVETDLDDLIVLDDSEVEGVIISEIDEGSLGHLGLEEGVVVLLREVDWLLSDADSFEKELEVESPLADVIVLREDIEVPALENEEVVVSWCLDVEVDSVVE
jgi:hypothetical protein